MDEQPCVVHVAPHPDDEVLGAGATLLRLRRGGWHVVDVVASLGRLNEHSLRRRETVEAATRAGFELVVPQPPLPMSHGDDLVAAEAQLRALLVELIGARRPMLVISPSPQDGHPGHELVGRAVRDGIVDATESMTWWMWGLWADLPFPVVYSPFDERSLDETVHILDAHESQLTRNDYRTVLRARAEVNAVLGSERVFGFGEGAASEEPYAEIFGEAIWRRPRWFAGPPRVLDVDAPLPLPTTREIGWWLHERSAQARDRP